MSQTSDPSRRHFVKLCASALAVAGSLPQALARSEGVTRSYARVRLTDADGEPLAAASLEVGETYLFHYPFVATPCFLINLGEPAPANGDLVTEDGRHYSWAGGVGPDRGIVAFSAICAHKMSHPARNVSFIDYRHETVSFMDGEKRSSTRDQVIYCCSEGSVYDPARGAKVLGGPAPQPLAAILLDYDPATDGLHATGTCGADMFERFFRTFGFRLQLEMRRSDIDARVAGSAPVMRLDEYSGNRIHC